MSASPKKTSILLRSLGLQLFLNYKTMQGPGYLYALKSELKGQDALKARAAGSFINGHPAFSGIALGALTARLREPVDETNAEEIAEWKRGLSTPLGAIGDSLIWERFKPALLAIMAGVMLLAGNEAIRLWGWSAAALLLIYNLTLWWFRNWGFEQGFRLGERASELALHPALPVLRRRLRVLGILAASFVFAAAIGGGMKPVSASLISFTVGFLIMMIASYMRFSTLTAAFLSVLSSVAIFYFTLSPSH